MKCFSLYGSNNSDSVVLGYADIAEIKDHSFRTTPFQKNFAIKVLGMCLPYVKRYVEEHQLRAFVFMAQIT